MRGREVQGRWGGRDRGDVPGERVEGAFGNIEKQ